MKKNQNLYFIPLVLLCPSEPCVAESLSKDDILKRSKKSFKPSFAKAYILRIKLRSTQSEARRMFTPERSRRIRMSAYIVISLIFAFHHVNYALIIESNRLDTILNYLSPFKNTLVIFDIDNTLAHPTEELGSDEWFCHKVEEKKSEGFDHLTAVYYVLPILFYTQFNIDLEPTEKNIPELIAYLIDNNNAVMALSTRSLPIVERTLEQLHNIDIHFFMPEVEPYDVVLPMPLPCFYKDGILFAGNNDKGEVLHCFFDIMNYYPEIVIFIDDKLKYLQSVEKTLEKYHIPFIGIRYSGCDERVKNFDPTKSEAQLHAIKKRNSRKQ